VYLRSEKRGRGPTKRRSNDLQNREGEKIMELSELNSHKLDTEGK